MPAPALERDATGKFIPLSQSQQAEADKAKAEKPPEPVKVTPVMQRLAEEFAEIPEKERQPEKAKTEAKPKPAPAAPAKPKPVARPAPTLTAEQIAAAAAEGATRALTAKPKVEPETKLKEDDSVFSDPDKKRITVLARMEKLMPAQYKGIADKYRTSLKKESAYIEKWQTEHPGQEFDKESDDHNAFYEANDIDWSDDDYMDAQADIRAEAKVAEKMKPVEGKLSEYDRLQKLNAAAPKIGEEQVFAAKELWKKFGKDFEKVITDTGLDEAEYKRVQDADPIANQIRTQAASALNFEAAEMYKLMNGIVEFDPENKIHTNIADFANRVEAELVQKPADEQLDSKNRQFLPAAKYYKLPKEEREMYYWTPTMRDLLVVRASELAANAAKAIAFQEENFNKWAAARGLSKKEAGNGEATQQPHRETPPEDESLETKDGKPISPTVDDQSRMAAVKERDKGKAQDALSARMEAFL